MRPRPATTSLTRSSYHRERFQDATVQLGGPLIATRCGGSAPISTPRLLLEPGTDPAFPTQDLQDRVFGKLTWQVNQNNNLLFAYHNDHWRLPDTITPSLPPEAAGMGRGHNPTVTATWRRVLNNNTTFDSATAASTTGAARAASPKT